MDIITAQIGLPNMNKFYLSAFNRQAKIGDDITTEHINQQLMWLASATQLWKKLTDSGKDLTVIGDFNIHSCTYFTTRNNYTKYEKQLSNLSY